MNLLMSIPPMALTGFLVMAGALAADGRAERPAAKAAPKHAQHRDATPRSAAARVMNAALTLIKE